MDPNGQTRIPDVLNKHEQELLNEWMREQTANIRQKSLLKDGELRSQCTQFLNLFRQAAAGENLKDIGSPQWNDVRTLLAEVSHSRGVQGFSPSETAAFVFSLKGPLFARLQAEIGRDADALGRETKLANDMLDKLGLYTTEVFQKTREEVIGRQQQEMLELSTPVVKLWDGILAIPLIGTLDSARTQVVMENLLQKIVDSGADVAIIDITGVPTVDTLVAQHLIKTVTAARLMGADCIISGIRPQIAQTIVHLGVDLGSISTKASLAEAFRLALQRTGQMIVRNQAQR